MEKSPSWESNGSQLVKKIPNNMEPKVLLSLSQVPITCPYPEPD